MTTSVQPLRGHDAQRHSRSAPRYVAAAARVYQLDEVAMTLEEVMEARGWDRRHRRYRRRPVRAH